MRLDISKLRGCIQGQADKESFSGVVAVFQKDKPVLQEALGYADVPRKRENNPYTRFAIASGTKFFTALGIGCLIDEGIISLDSTIDDIFHVRYSFINPKATIAQLLTHTSGIYDYLDEEIVADSENFYVEIPWSQLETPADYLPLVTNNTAKFSPGERFSYSNGGYIFLGIIIEHITGQLYRDYIQEHVFNPADMNASGYFAFNELPENTAYGYKRSRGGVPETNVNNLPIRGGSDGGAYTTVLDLNKLWRAVFDNRILSKELKEEFMQSQVNITGGVDYGYGVYITRFEEMNTYFIQGGDDGVGFDSRYIPETGLQITIISNQTDGEEKMREVIYSELLSS